MGIPVRDVQYRGPVEMSGWVQKFQSRIRTRQVKRYFKLNNSQLSNHPKLTGPATWEVSVSKCIIKSSEETCIVSVRLLDHEIRFQVATAELTRRWHSAIRSASECNIEDFYKLGKELGAGSFGAVRLAYDLTTGEKRAVKIVERTSNAKELEFVQREINVLLSISHKHIVRTHNIFDERDKIFLVMDYVPGGDFFDYMAKRGKLDELPAKVIVWQMLEGLAYLHNNNIVHRDIKPENVLIACEDPISIQLTDFGFANFIDPSSAAPATEMKSMVGYV
jgi:serine/threonine protein kinase